MKEKYIFFILLTIAILMLISAKVGTKGKGEMSAKELALEEKLDEAEQRQAAAPERIDLDKVEDLVAFSHYAGMLQRSPFFKAPAKAGAVAKKAVEPEIVPVEDTTPLFIYKGKIVSGKRLVILIEQTRSGEVFMVAKGENINGYKVFDILDTEVILSKKGEENIVLGTIEEPYK